MIAKVAKPLKTQLTRSFIITNIVVDLNKYSLSIVGITIKMYGFQIAHMHFKTHQESN